MPQNKEQEKRVKLDDKTIERGFGQVAEDISLLKNVIAKTVEEINRLKGFQYVLANILEECDIITKQELYELAVKKYSTAMSTEIKKFLDKSIPSLEKAISEQFESYSSHEDLYEAFEMFENMYFDKEGNPKAKA